MLVKEFSEKIEWCAEDIGCDGQGRINSHKMGSHVLCRDEEGNDYEIEEIELERLTGCACPHGILIRIRKAKK